MLQIREIRDCESLAELEPAWWDLWDRSPAATPFQSPAWLLPWCRAFAPGEILTLALRGEDRLLALAPFYVETGRLGRRLLPMGVSVSDYQDILIEPALADAIAEVLVRHLALLDWDQCELPELAIKAAAFRLPRPPGCNAVTMPQSCAPVLYLPPDERVLTDVIPKGKQRKWRMARRRAARRDGFAISSSAPADAPRALDTLIELHGMRWTERGEAGVFSDPRAVGFYRQAVGALARRNLVRLYTLSFEGRAAGVYYGFQHRGRAYAYIGGFDPRDAFESPGTVLMGHAISEASREGATEFHFLRGDEAYKFEWGAVGHWTYRRVFNRIRAYARAG